MSSFRARLFLGAFLWTIGLGTVAVIAMTLVMLRHPGYPRVMHINAYNHAAPLTVVAALCMAGGLWAVTRALSPVVQLRLRLSDVRDGRTRRLEGRYPSEVQPLVDDLNGLLDLRERAIERAVAKAGDLAHGLKTPLALLAQEAERAAAAGQHELGAAIAQQIDRMRRQTDYHLAQARAAASGPSSGAQCGVAAAVEGLVRTVQRLYAERGIRIDDRVPPGHTVRCQREDLDEMLGNLLDNACKWARSQVAVESTARDGVIEIAIDDDGGGLPAAMRPAVLQRGVRADEAAPGTGLGLAIVRDLAELYGGSIRLDDSPLQGLRARLTLPRGADFQ